MAAKRRNFWLISFTLWLRFFRRWKRVRNWHFAWGHDYARKKKSERCEEREKERKRWMKIALRWMILKDAGRRVEGGGWRRLVSRWGGEGEENEAQAGRGDDNYWQRVLRKSGDCWKMRFICSDGTFTFFNDRWLLLKF